ncbi:uncharacterized protein B0H18DRAFT_1008577 [Fomitopsis serialis]|uniref:uncharacterized protein n=1 Tax=Fomitopsis serialis TaxID=139415 RepID=UPI002007A401|nr:uncharacterized protein B0H18DRAFT_1008577 [Neoantrodia serialis]KAH9925828.1 hypothetical protein B0H18DRAFT_1008577 [Neoantrodia serialis]
MRILSAFLLFLGTGITAFAHPRNAPPPPRPLPGARALKQAHVLRSSEDTCGHLTGSALQLAAVDLALELTADVLGILLGLDICLCLSLLPLELDVGLGLDALVPLLGLGDLNLLLEAAHLCGWNCKPPYVKQGDQCECNGVCGSSRRQNLTCSSGCGSSTPWKRDAIGNRPRATCGRDEIVCGVYGGSPLGFECLNVNKTLESCGGCTVPNPFLSVTGGAAVSAPGVGIAKATGVDCSSISGVAGVSCVAGRCAVSSCGAGWVVNSSGDGCVHVSALAVQQKRSEGLLIDLVADVVADVQL